MKSMLLSCSIFHQLLKAVQLLAHLNKQTFSVTGSVPCRTLALPEPWFIGAFGKGTGSDRSVTTTLHVTGHLGHDIKKAWDLTSALGLRRGSVKV